MVFHQSPLFLSLFSTLLPTSRVTSSILWTLCDAVGALALIRIWRARQRVSSSSRDGLIGAVCVTSICHFLQTYCISYGLEHKFLAIFKLQLEYGTRAIYEWRLSPLHSTTRSSNYLAHSIFQISPKSVFIPADPRTVDVDIRKYADPPVDHVRQRRCVYPPYIYLLIKHSICCDHRSNISVTTNIICFDSTVTTISITGGPVVYITCR